ncbi:7-cyano-7-deazaguanine synthase QueC [Streptomyces sp. DSM 44917]|uniref:7-cyano-7-deazaguanine synthase n=1 Tax=Streptomyces boetiae TaxID=3075541 RepID=A0ABU2L8H4_9ACTN|nr:7-cyano-7-deazaguanine synthase QueC [Streptomyces sp. DSM 44917]MDT0307642.1 7-cyano-7-deazaguanine synthase QueC [Streptomyces sp. DSM 44917]
MSRSLPSSPVPDVVVVFSGGLDSTTAAYQAAASGARPTLLSVDYGQRHRTELDHAVRLAGELSAPHHVVDLRALGGLLNGSSLTDTSVDVPEGHYTDTSMRATVVPHRNALLLDLAVAAAIGRGAGAVIFGAHAGDHPIYPDCRPAFLTAYRRMVRVANEGFLPAGFKVRAPFLNMTKADIVRLGTGLGVPYELTWSCYEGGRAHCGVCGTCTERREAFRLAEVPDPTRYAAPSAVTR